MSIVIYPPSMVPAYIVRSRGDETKRDGSGRDIDVVPFDLDAAFRWLSVVTEYTRLCPLMRPFRVVYSKLLGPRREKVVKIRIQGFVADHHLNSTKIGSECPASLSLEGTNWITLVSGYRTFEDPFMSQVAALQRLTDAVLRHLFLPPTAAPLSPILVLRRSAALTPLRTFRMFPDGARRHDRWLRVRPGDLIEASVYLDVVVSPGHGLAPHVSVFPAFDEVTLVRTALEMYAVTRTPPFLIHAQIPSRFCECMCPGFSLHRTIEPPEIDVATDDGGPEDADDVIIPSYRLHEVES